ncbi:MAG TPA: hypothetical protein VLJ80_08475 [Solirubrobacteraceae bacterium]|nr:hypothetical protein [Solirubrobacteraceae bacterium]
MRPLRLIPLGLALLAFAGCGGTSHADEERKISETFKRAERKSQRELSSEEVAERKRQHELKALESEEPTGGEQTPAEAAKEAREAAARESAPDSHHYPAAVRAAFVRACENNSGHEDAACKCAIKRIEAKVALGRFRQNEAEVRAGKPISFIYSYEIGYCASSNAASG